MINKSILPGSALISVLLLSGCGDTNILPPANQLPAATTTPVTQTTTPPATTSQLAPGTYCYSAKTKTLDANATINISSNNQIKGQIQATIQNPAENYYSSYNQTLTGELIGETAKLKIVTKIENDTQNSQVNWTITPSQLKTDRETFVKADCASSKADQETSATKKPVRVSFPKGASSTTVKNAVVRGDRDTYILGAKQGQTINLKITSLEKNAVFEVIAPNGQTLIPEATTWNGKLPVNGDYQVIVGGTRGNASYELAVEIK
ncbi:hypothetical protein [Calothrix sp. NIES-3974]|uniref:hypothetical protein n=1 Tax=Calothrix sp. NIES-3974 TaxID=2005462 RepID=UPI000B61DFA4|nr:hypothetical protein [Calothrix sp. NIES-3974]BAZ06116.1 hypothetical protein NIES3974_27730 [Calothrix sp. NIES-3974]